MISSAFIVACLVSIAHANPIARSMAVHESRKSVPIGFAQTGTADGSTVLTLRVGLVQNNVAGLEQELYAVSTPSNARYGQHLTKEEVESYVKPSDESTNLVTQWLSENGLTAKTISPAGDWLEFSVPVSKANELLDTNFQTFTHTESGLQSIRTMSYSIPTNLQGHLALIHPTITMTSPFTLPVKTSSKKTSSKRASKRAVPSSCDTVITPACLQALYGIPTTLATQSSNIIGVSAFTDEFANIADLQSFLTQYRPDLDPSTTFTVQSIDNGENDQDEPGLEANLDTQYTIGLASGVAEIFYTDGDEVDTDADFINTLITFANTLLAESTLPQVLTTSYGVDETDASAAAANQLCTAFMQLGARGTSVLFASGDGGVAGGHGISGCTTFVPAFPGGCPYLTAVGATSGIDETAADFSSGGFSDIFAQPSYQSAAVSAYLSELGSTNAGLYNATGRGFPDVSAQGVDFQIIIDGETVGVDGTSCSSPTFASVIALLNDELIAAGKSALGFLNPLLYASASALNDVTSGDNPGCGTNGFPALAGWDPVTGLGTPNYAALRTAVGL